MAVVKDLILEIAYLRIKGYTDKKIQNKLHVPLEWIHCAAVNETVKSLR